MAGLAGLASALQSAQNAPQNPPLGSTFDDEQGNSMGPLPGDTDPLTAFLQMIGHGDLAKSIRPGKPVPSVSPGGEIPASSMTPAGTDLPESGSTAPTWMKMLLPNTLGDRHPADAPNPQDSKVDSTTQSVSDLPGVSNLGQALSSAVQGSPQIAGGAAPMNVRTDPALFNQTGPGQIDTGGADTTGQPQEDGAGRIAALEQSIRNQRGVVGQSKQARDTAESAALAARKVVATPTGYLPWPKEALLAGIALVANALDRHHRSGAELAAGARTAIQAQQGAQYQTDVAKQNLSAQQADLKAQQAGRATQEAAGTLGGYQQQYEQELGRQNELQKFGIRADATVNSAKIRAAATAHASDMHQLASANVEKMKLLMSMTKGPNAVAFATNELGMSPEGAKAFLIETPKDYMLRNRGDLESAQADKAAAETQTINALRQGKVDNLAADTKLKGILGQIDDAKRQEVLKHVASYDADDQARVAQIYSNIAHQRFVETDQQAKSLAGMVEKHYNALLKAKYNPSLLGAKWDTKQEADLQDAKSEIGALEAGHPGVTGVQIDRSDPMNPQVLETRAPIANPAPPQPQKQVQNAAEAMALKQYPRLMDFAGLIPSKGKVAVQAMFRKAYPKATVLPPQLR